MKHLRILVVMLGIILSTGIYAGQKATKGEQAVAQAQNLQTMTISGTIIKKEVTRKKGDTQQKYARYYIQTEEKKMISLAKKVAKKANLVLEQLEGKKYSFEAKVEVSNAKKGKKFKIVEIVKATPLEQAADTTPQPAK